MQPIMRTSKLKLILLTSTVDVPLGFPLQGFSTLLVTVLAVRFDIPLHECACVYVQHTRPELICYKGELYYLKLQNSETLGIYNQYSENILEHHVRASINNEMGVHPRLWSGLLYSDVWQWTQPVVLCEEKHLDFHRWQMSWGMAETSQNRLRGPH